MAKVLLYSTGIIGRTMSGPGIRYWEFAQALSKNHDVTLLIPNPVDIETDKFKVCQRQGSFDKYLKGKDVVISLHMCGSLVWSARRHDVTIIYDAYAPTPFECLEGIAHLPIDRRVEMQKAVQNGVNFAFRMADFAICASQRQADLWLGMLLALHKVVPQSSLDNSPYIKKIDVVPFGLSSQAPIKNGPGLKASLNLHESSKVVLWGGCLANWFDPLSLIRAFHLLGKNRPDIHLVFMGVDVPDDSVKKGVLNMAEKAKQLAKELDLFDKTVHFNQKWVPYNQRTGYLLEADIGISTHLNHSETRYSFRTRLLDYIWAEIPIINSEGDCFSELINKEGVGLTVSCGNSQAIADAIMHILEAPGVAGEMKLKLKELKKRFYWENVVKPLEVMINTPVDRISKSSVLRQIVWSLYKDKGALHFVRHFMMRMLRMLGIVNKI